MKTSFGTSQHLLQSIVLLILLTCLTSCTVPVSGIRLSTDPLDDVLQGPDQTGDDALTAKKGDPQVAGMWFGPRLGRRDRRSAAEMLDDVADGTVEEILEILAEAGWTLVPVRGAKLEPGDFVPRLGRDSKEDEDPDMKQRSPPFAPRLGRRLVPFRPRMGRDRLPHDVYSPRLGRSVHPQQLHENKQPPQH